MHLLFHGPDRGSTAGLCPVAVGAGRDGFGVPQLSAATKPSRDGLAVEEHASAIENQRHALADSRGQRVVMRT